MSKEGLFKDRRAGTRALNKGEHRVLTGGGTKGGHQETNQETIRGLNQEQIDK